MRITTAQLEGIVRWIITSKNKPDDNIHIKRVRAKAKQTARISGIEFEALIDRSMIDLIDIGIFDCVEKIDKHGIFAYISVILYKSVFPNLINKTQKEYLDELAKNTKIGIL